MDGTKPYEFIRFKAMVSLTRPNVWEGRGPKTPNLTSEALPRPIWFLSHYCHSAKPKLPRLVGRSANRKPITPSPYETNRNTR